MKIFAKKFTVILLIMTMVMVIALMAGCDAFDRYDENVMSENNTGNDDNDIIAIIDNENEDSQNSESNKSSGSIKSSIESSIDKNIINSEKDNSSNDYAEGGNGNLDGSSLSIAGNSGTNSDTGNKAEEIHIEAYYQDNEGYLIPVTRRVPKQLSIAKASIKALIDTPINREEIAYFGLYPTLPQGTEFTINIKEGIAVIDFNNKVLDYKNEIVEYNFVASVVYTLTQFETINEVRILINGYMQQLLKYGTDISRALSRKNILVNSVEGKKGINLTNGMQKIDIYLLKTIKNNVCILPVSLECVSLNEDNLQGEIIKKLSTIPQNQELFSEVPNNLELIGSSIKSGLLTLNFDIDISNYGGTQREYGMVNQILYSMKQINGIDKVRFLINGEVKDLIEGTDISKPIPIPSSINDIIDI